MNNVYLLDLIKGISKALDYVSSTVTGHHRRVGIASAVMSKELGLNATDTTDLVMAALLHDIGAFSLDLKLDGLDFDADLTEHSFMGYRLLRDHPLLERASQIVRFHHTSWKDLQEKHENIDQQTRFLSNILNLMDRVDVLGKVGTNIFDRTQIRNVISSYSNALYDERAVQTFMTASTDDRFWEKVKDQETPLRDLIDVEYDDPQIPRDQLIDFSGFFSHIIDFRSRHTATHSQGVAETAVQLAKLASMNSFDQKKMRLAGNLHDIGKLAVPLHLLDKPAKLDPKEYEVVQNHAVVCETVIRSIPGLEDVADWACQHHERLNGKGYPHGLVGKEISLGSRIMAVADVYTAITEDRPYRNGMSEEKAHTTLNSMAHAGFLDEELVALAMENFQQIDAMRRMVQSRAFSEFKRFRVMPQ